MAACNLDELWGPEASSLSSSQATPLDKWVNTRIRNGKIKEDFTDEEYDHLIQMARLTSRTNWNGASDSSAYSKAGEQMRASLSTKLGDRAVAPPKRGTFDYLVPDVGNLHDTGLLAESRHFARRRYKKSTDKNVETVRRHWFEFCFTIAFISPVRPQPGNSFDAATTEEDIARCFATFLARKVTVGETVGGYISLWKRWHRSVVGWDPISSANVQAQMLSQTLAGIRAELPSKGRSRFAHPTRLFKEWWAPLERKLGVGSSIESIMDFEPTDLSSLSWEERLSFAKLLQSLIAQSGMSFEDLKHLIVSTTMTAALLRVSEAIPEAGSEQAPPTLSDLRFVWDDSGRLLYAELMMLPLKKGTGVVKVPIKIPYSKGNVRSAFFLWLLSALDPVPDSAQRSLPLFRQWSWECSTRAPQVIKQDDFRKWYQNKMKEAGIKHWKHYNTHSFRIGGATALLGAKVSMELIKAMGRWASDIAEIYTRPTVGTILELGIELDVVDARPFEDADDGFFDRMAGITEDDAEDIARAIAEEATPFENDAE